MKKIFLFFVFLIGFGANALAFTVDDIPNSFSFSSLSYNPYWGNSKNKQSDIRYLQVVLNEDPKTYAGISADGIFGKGTHNALVSFQSNHELSADGIAGSNTKRELDEVLQSLKNSNNNCQPELQLDRDSIKINTSINQSIIHGNDNIHVSAQVYNNSFDCKSNQYSITVKYAGRTSSKNDVPYENSFKTKSSKVYAAINPRQYGGTEQSKNFSIDNLSGTHWLKVCVSTAKNLYGDDCEYKTFDVVASSNTQESPRPNISIVPSAIVPHVGQLFEITAKAVNKGGASNDGYITVSFPDYTDPKDKDSLRIISAENGVQTYIKRKGDTIFDKNLQSMEADCLMVELRDTNWQKNETHELKFKLLVKDTPTNFIRVFYRSTMKDKSTGKYINYPSSSIKTDQQEWSCKDKNIKIIEKAKSTLFDAKSKFLGKSNNALLNLYKAEVFLANTIYGESTLFVDDGVPLYYDKNKYAELIGYRYNQENGFVGGLYRVNDNDKGEPKYVLAYGGTSAKDAFEDKSSLLKDILTDINLLNKNKKSIQVSDAYNFYSKMKQKFHLTKHNTTITGHSLGGGLAQYVSYLTGIKAITINTAPIPISWLDSNYMLKKVDIINFMAENDPLTTILTNFEDIEVGYHVSSKPIRHQGYLDLIDAFCADSMISIGGIYILDDFAISQNMNLIDFHLAITAFAIHENKKAFLYLKNALGIEDYSLKDLILGQRISISNSATSSSGHSIEKFINAVYNFDDLTKEKLIDYVNSGISGKLHKTPSLKNIQKYSSRAYSAQKVSKSYRVASSTGVGSSSSNPLMADSLTPTLVFSDFDNFADGGTHTATWFDVRRNDDRKFLYDSGWMKGDIAQAQIPEGYLNPNTVYRVRLVYQDSRGKLTKVGYGYFKTEVITKPEVKHTTIDFIGQTGAMVIADIDTYNDPSTKAYISFNSSGLNLIDLKQDQKKIYYSVKNLQCNTNYYYIVTLEDSHGNYGYSDKKFFKTLPCASQVQLTAKDGSALIAFPKTKVGECSTGKVLLKKLDSIYDATGELSFSDILKDNSAFEMVDGSYSLSYKGETKEKEIKFCPTKEGEQMAFVQLKKGNIEFESYPTLVFVSGEGVEVDSANFKTTSIYPMQL